MAMTEKTELLFLKSPSLFQQRCKYIWHRKFNEPEQLRILNGSNAALVTYFTKHKAPYGSRMNVTEQTIMKVPLPVHNAYIQDFTALASTLIAFRPDEFEIVFGDDTYEDENAVLAMWWHRGRLPIVHESVATEGVETECIKVLRDDVEGFAKVRKHFGNRPVNVYGDGPWLVTTAPLSDEHARKLLGVLDG